MKVKIRLGELRCLLREAIVDPPGDWRYFHVTPNDLGNEFTFTPRTPTWNSYTGAEDFTTPRVSLATTVEKAVHGKFGTDDPRQFGQLEMFVYACQSVPHLLVPRSGDDLGSRGNPWGPDWSFDLYAEENNVEVGKEAHAELVRGRITDDPKVTGEVWSLTPVRMVLVGRLWPSRSGSPRIHQKWRLRSSG